MFVGSRPKGVDFLPALAGQVEIAGIRLQLLQLVTYIKSLSPSKTEGKETTAPARDNNPQTGAATPEGQGAKSPESQRSNPVNTTAPRGNQRQPSQ